MDQRDRGAHDAQRGPRGESNAQRVGGGITGRAMGVGKRVVEAAADGPLPRHDGA